MKDSSLYLMALIYIAAGINHFINKRQYLGIMPPVLPYHEVLVYLSGACEVILGVLLIPFATRHMAAWLIVLLLVAIFPANIYMAIKWHRKRHKYLWLAYIRLPLQLVLIWWAYQFVH